MPLGGASEKTGSHKGYGWGMVCELFSSILSMGNTSDECCTFDDKTGICHGFIVIDPGYLRRSHRNQGPSLRLPPEAAG